MMCFPGRSRADHRSSVQTLVEDYDLSCIECDGSFPSHGGIIAGSCGDSPVIIEKTVGKGTVIVTSVHEYPSLAFVKKFCCQGTQTLF